MLTKENNLILLSIVSKIYGFLFKNSITLPFGVTEVFLDVEKLFRDCEEPYEISLVTHDEHLGVIKSFKTEQEAFDWLKNGKKSTRVVNAKVKEFLAEYIIGGENHSDSEDREFNATCFPEKDADYLNKIREKEKKRKELFKAGKEEALRTMTLGEPDEEDEDKCFISDLIAKIDGKDYYQLTEQEGDLARLEGWYVNEWYNKEYDWISLHMDLSTGECHPYLSDYFVKVTDEDKEKFDTLSKTIETYYNAQNLKEKGIELWELLVPVSDFEGCPSTSSWALLGRLTPQECLDEVNLSSKVDLPNI